MGTNTAKPYKIQDSEGSRRIGITAENLKDLRRKAVKRLNISDDYLLCLEDGTEVTSEEYFKSLPPQICFTFINPDEGNLQADLLQVEKLTQKVFNKLSERQTIAAEEVKQFLTGPNNEVINRALLDYISCLQLNIDAESREEDEAWFDGLSKKFRSKEAVMKAGAQSRIRNYYNKTKEYVMDQNVTPYTMSLVETFHKTLRSNEYHGNYFVRSAEKSHRICDEHGWFRCQGAFDEKKCSNRHSINPYGSREARIVFSTWNLDHVIEKSREVLPTFVEVAKDCPKNSDVNWKYFYDLLFTKRNLKLVHIACHIKAVHGGKKCDKNEFYKTRTTTRKITKAKHIRTRKPKR